MYYKSMIYYIALAQFVVQTSNNKIL